MEMFGRELTLEQIRGFVEGYEKDGEIRMPSEWVLELIEKAQENEKLKGRLQISPQGDDKIDELEQALEFAKFDMERLKNVVIPIEGKEIPKKPKIMDTTLVGEKFWWYCGHCEASRHTGSKSNYCGYCGGKVDWD